MTFTAYPRLDHAAAQKLAREIAGMSGEERIAAAGVEHPRRFVHPTASRVVNDEQLLTFRRAVLTAQERAEGSVSRDRSFDSDLIDVVAGLEGLAPAEAGRAEVWNFLTLVVLPDVAFWRWPVTKDGLPNQRRVLGGPRNIFRRVWWRCHLLEPARVRFLSEDELVGITERAASLGSSPVVARAFTDVLRESVERGEVAPSQREAVVRAYAKGALRRGAVLAFFAMTPDELMTVFREVLSETLDAMESRPAPLPTSPPRGSTKL
ncbi:hypothetical protein [Kytococcus sedentarius]|uniref:hypothetical protein n=1 Tax=Kytococcus sedentarius TaxID=1276 RepID=UPI0035BC39AC